MGTSRPARRKTRVHDGTGNTGTSTVTPTPGRFELKVVEGPDKGLRGEFDQARVKVGTATGLDLVLTDPTVSRIHLLIDTADGRFSLSDLGSTNGTLLGGFKVAAAYLSNECYISLGDTVIGFRSMLMGPQQPSARDGLGPLIGATPAMRRLYDLIERAAETEISVILEGETGTGKDLVARLLHEQGPRRNGPFEVLDCTAIPDNLVEAELFGHTRGAFTGADQERVGVFERAHGGTLFLDEIGEIKLELQPKLLRVLEARTVKRVGGDKSMPVDVRVVAATHRSLRTMVERGQFREDLYYRLAGCKLTLPPLRERLDDIPRLAEHFLASLGGARRQLQLSPGVLSSLRQKPWPGNVRQLRNSVTRLALMDDEISQVEDPRQTSKESVEVRLPLAEAKEDFERRYVTQLLAVHNGDLKAAAEAAGLHMKSLARILRRHGLARGSE